MYPCRSLSDPYMHPTCPLCLLNHCCLFPPVQQAPLHQCMIVSWPCIMSCCGIIVQDVAALNCMLLVATSHSGYCSSLMVHAADAMVCCQVGVHMLMDYGCAARKDSKVPQFPAGAFVELGKACSSTAFVHTGTAPLPPMHMLLLVTAPVPAPDTCMLTKNRLCNIHLTCAEYPLVHCPFALVPLQAAHDPYRLTICYWQQHTSHGLQSAVKKGRCNC